MTRPPRPPRQRADLTLDRLLILARLLVAGWCTLAQLSEALGCTVRTIQRGLVTLRRAGLEVERRHTPTEEARFRMRRSVVLAAFGVGRKRQEVNDER